MNLSREGAMELIGHEAIVLTRYKDSVGIFTIGVGHTKAAGDPDPETFTGALSLPQVFDLFFRDVQKYVDTVNKYVLRPVSQTQFDALVSFHYNTGAIRKASLTQKINSGDFSGAANAFMAWVKPKEIIGRRKKEQKLFATGEYSNKGMAMIYPATSGGSIQWGKGRRVDLKKTLDEGKQIA